MNLKGKIILVLILFVGITCDNSINSEDGVLITHTLCKNEKNLTYETNETCVEYAYDTDGKTLNLKHINTGFNCCPSKLYCNISIEGDTIRVEESERKQDCSCICLYDIEAEVYNVEPKVYIIKYIEPYIGDYAELIFAVDLSASISGSVCLERNNYPWGN